MTAASVCIAISTGHTRSIKQLLTVGVSLSASSSNILPVRRFSSSSTSVSVSQVSLHRFAGFTSTAVSPAVTTSYAKASYFLRAQSVSTAVSSGTTNASSDTTGIIVGMVSYWKMEESYATRMDSHGTNHLIEVQ